MDGNGQRRVEGAQGGLDRGLRTPAVPAPPRPALAEWRRGRGGRAPPQAEGGTPGNARDEDPMGKQGVYAAQAARAGPEEPVYDAREAVHAQE